MTSAAFTCQLFSEQQQSQGRAQSHMPASDTLLSPKFCLTFFSFSFLVAHVESIPIDRLRVLGLHGPGRGSSTAGPAEANDSLPGHACRSSLW